MFAAPHPVTLQGTIACIPSGFSGVMSTLRVMRRLVRQYKTDLSLLQTARDLVFLAPPKNEAAEVDAIFSYVRDMIRYTRDVYDVETISSPDKTLALRVGDCDDKSTLLATLLECVGYPTRFVVTGYQHPKHYEHVYVQVLIGDEWIDADATESEPLGFSPPNPVAIFIEEI